MVTAEWFTREQGRSMRDLLAIAAFIREVEGMRDTHTYEGDFVRVD